MKNQRGPGNAIVVAAPAGGVIGGTAYLIGRLFGVAANDAAQTIPVAFWILGVYQLAKAGSQAWTVGAPIYWDNGAKVCTTTSAGNTAIGWATEPVDALAGSTLGYVCLTPQVS